MKIFHSRTKMQELKRSENGGKLKSRKKLEPPPEDGPFSNSSGLEVVAVKKKKKKSKHSTEGSEIEVVTLTKAFETMKTCDEEVTFKKKKKKSKNVTEDNEVGQEVTSTIEFGTISDCGQEVVKKNRRTKHHLVDIENASTETNQDLESQDAVPKVKRKKKKYADGNTSADENGYQALESSGFDIREKSTEENEVLKKKKKTKIHLADVENASIETNQGLENQDAVFKVKRKKKKYADGKANADENALESNEFDIEEKSTDEKAKPKKEKKSKRKRLSGSSVGDQLEEMNLPEPPDSSYNLEHDDRESFIKKKKVSWKENISESKEPEVFKDEKMLVNSDPANNVFLALLSNHNAIPDQQITRSLTNHRLLSSKKDYLESRNLKIARKKERKLQMRKAKKEQMELLNGGKNHGESGVQKCITDCNIKNRKLKEKIAELVGSSENMDVKRPRLDEEITSGPTRKRLRSITPDREIIPGLKWKDLTEEQKGTFNKTREQRRLEKLTVPKILLINQANFSSMRLEDEERSPLTLSDIQHFLIYSLHAHRGTGNIPTWVSLKFSSRISKVICVVVDGASLSDYTLHEDRLPALKSFSIQLEVITAYAYGGDFAKEFWAVPLTRNQRAKMIRKYGSLKAANLKGEAFESVRKMYPKGAFRAQKTNMNELESNNIAHGITINNSIHEFIGINDQFPRTELLLRSWDLLRESVPVPFATGFLAKRYKGFVQTKDQYCEVTDHSPIWAVDCEMCETKAGSELTRISVINENFEVVYESLVKPYNPIVNYLTQYSGITREDLVDECTRLEDVQQDLRSLLPPDVILAGHSIGNDLMAMKMFHPYVIDTSVCFNLSGIKGRKTKLKTLMAELLYERIQEGGKDGHDSVEDAASCLKLIKAKLARSLEWGDAVLGGVRSEMESVIAQQQLLLRSKQPKKPTVYPRADGAIIRSGPRAHQTVDQGSKHSKEEKRDIVRREHKITPQPLKPLFEENVHEPTNQNVLTRSLASHLFASGEKNLLVVGRGEFLKAGKEFIDRKSKKLMREGPGLVFEVRDDPQVLPYGFENAPSNGISILRVDSSRLREKTPLEKVDAMIGEAVKNFKENILLTVLLPGKRLETETSAMDNHGLFMMKILKPPYARITLEELSQSTS